MTDHDRSTDESRRGADDGSAGADDGTETTCVSITPDPETAEYELLEVIAELEGKEIEDLPSLYTQVDHFVETLFENPPSPEAQVELTFSYAGYRITVMQDGDVKLVPVKDTLGG